MIDVRMREPDGAQVQAQARDFGLDHLQVTAGVDDSGVSGGIAPDDGAVLRKRGDGNGVVAEHGRAVRA